MNLQSRPGKSILRLIVQFGVSRSELDSHAFWSDHEQKKLRKVCRSVSGIRGRWILIVHPYHSNHYAQIEEFRTKTLPLLLSLQIQGLHFRDGCHLQLVCGCLHFVKAFPLVRTVIFDNRVETFDDLIRILSSTPSSVTTLSLCHGLTGFSSVWTSLLPPGLKNLKMGSCAQSLSSPLSFNWSLPSTLTHFHFFDSFNHPLSDARSFLPFGLTHLTFGSAFNQRLSRSDLPTSLTHLSFGTSFNQIFDFPLPAGLVDLKFPLRSQFNHSLEGVLPPGLRQICLGGRYNHPLNFWPTSLLSLELSETFDQPNLSASLPLTLRVLVLGYSFNQPMTSWPSHLISLTLGWSFRQSLDGLTHCHSLRHLAFRNQYRVPRLPPLPLLTHLSLPILKNEHPVIQVNDLSIRLTPAREPK